MRRAPFLVAVVWLAGCAGANASPTPPTLSCQPYGATPEPVAIPYAPGPVTQAVAEQSATTLFRACVSRGGTLTGVMAGSVTSTGMRQGPNQVQPVWLVQVDATVNEPPPGASYQAHFLIEVNQATGVPTIVGQG